MSGSAPSNTSAVNFQQQQAADAAAKEAQRQQRLTQGQAAIDAIYSGQPVMKATPSTFDWNNLKNQSAQFDAYTGAGGSVEGTQASGLPTGYTTTKTATGYGIKDPTGKIYNPGDAIDYTANVDTGQRTGGFDDAFYNKFNQKVLDYYNPQEEQQYGNAKRDLLYNLAQSGNLQSSVAADKQGELAAQDALNKADIVKNANTQTGQLRDTIQSQKESLVNQLYSTEDPTLTANLAQSSAKASQLQDPMLTPSAALFTPAMSAAGSVASGFGYGQQYQTPYGTTPQQGATPPPANDKTSGKLTSGNFS